MVLYLKDTIRIDIDYGGHPQRCDRRSDIIPIGEGMPVKKIARLEKLDEVFEGGKPGVGQVGVIVDALGRGMSDDNIQPPTFAVKIPKESGRESSQAGKHLPLGILVLAAGPIPNATTDPGYVQPIDLGDL